MAETQQTISEWAEATFGPATSNARVAARANEEMAELLAKLVEDDPTAPAEVADVVIVLARLATRLGVDMTAVRVPEHTPDAVVMDSFAATNLYMAALLRLLTAQDDPAPLSRSVLALLLGSLRSMALVMGFDLDVEVAKKMALNRQRTWKLDGTGHGYHVRQETTQG